MHVIPVFHFPFTLFERAVIDRSIIYVYHALVYQSRQICSGTIIYQTNVKYLGESSAERWEPFRYNWLRFNSIQFNSRSGCDRSGLFSTTIKGCWFRHNSIRQGLLNCSVISCCQCQTSENHRQIPCRQYISV